MNIRNKRIRREELENKCVKEYTRRHKKINQEVLRKLGDYIDNSVSFDQDGRTKNGVNIENLLDEFEKTL